MLYIINIYNDIYIYIHIHIHTYIYIYVYMFAIVEKSETLHYFVGSFLLPC